MRTERGRCSRWGWDCRVSRPASARTDKTVFSALLMVIDYSLCACGPLFDLVYWGKIPLSYTGWRGKMSYVSVSPYLLVKSLKFCIDTLGMTKTVSNRGIYLSYWSSVIMVRKRALFTKFCIAWLNLPPSPLLQYGFLFGISGGWVVLLLRCCTLKILNEFVPILMKPVMPVVCATIN